MPAIALTVRRYRDQPYIQCTIVYKMHFIEPMGETKSSVSLDLS